MRTLSLNKIKQQRETYKVHTITRKKVYNNVLRSTLTTEIKSKSIKFIIFFYNQFRTQKIIKIIRKIF